MERWKIKMKSATHLLAIGCNLHEFVVRGLLRVPLVLGDRLELLRSSDLTRVPETAEAMR